MKKKYTFYIALLLLPVHLSAMNTRKNRDIQGWPQSSMDKFIDSDEELNSPKTAPDIGSAKYIPLKEYCANRLKFYVSITYGLCGLGLIAYQVAYNIYS